MKKQRPEIGPGSRGTEFPSEGESGEPAVASAPATPDPGTETASVKVFGHASVERVADAVWQPVAPSKSSSPFGPPRPVAFGLAGNFERMENPTLLGLADALLKSPANVVYQLNHSRASLLRFVLLVVGSLLLTGVVVASFSGGYQYLAVPLKLAFGFVFGAALCLPSLYIFSCLSGTQHTLRNVTAALLMGMGVQGLLLIGFAPIAWIFSQSTSSPSFMGFLYLAMLLVSAGFGLALTGRVLAATGDRARVLWIWNMMFVVVMLQLTTNLRPIVGEFDGVKLGEKEFFLSHWGRSLSGEM
ncbi:MAG TPA: hypothetical protein VFU02_09625 [Polyangiaceae bacterium]|nr:hypothetical protein [Polyangiaceae bacterium]